VIGLHLQLVFNVDVVLGALLDAVENGGRFDCFVALPAEFSTFEQGFSNVAVAFFVVVRSQLNQILFQPFLDLNQPVRVIPGLVEQFGRHGPHPPVRSRQTFVQIDVQLVCDQVLQALRTEVQLLACDESVEHVHDLDATVFLQPLHVLPGSVQDLEFTFVCKYFVEFA